MVALDSRGTPNDPRGLDPTTLARLRQAITARLRAEEGAHELLGDALRAASTEAKASGMRAERLLIVLKEVGQQVEDDLRGAIRIDGDDRRKLREWLVSASLEAYFDS